MIDRLDLSERFASMWRKSREDAGKSQDYMARAMGVSRKTVQNWEAGTSCPSQERGFEWFIILDLQPLPYYLEILFPEHAKDLSHSDSDVDKILFEIIKGLPSHTKKELLYLLSGNHGSSLIAMIEMMTAHLQTPLRDRVNVAQSIALNYDIAKSSGRLKNPDHIQPDMDLLLLAISKGREASIRGNETYSMI